MIPPLAAVSQRGLLRSAVAERGDWLDERWYLLLQACGVVALPLPNHLDTAIALWGAAQPRALVLTGGNDLAYLPDAQDVWLQRDTVEQWALSTAERGGTLVIGICRGAQLLAHRAGAALARDTIHAGTRHAVHAAADAGFGWPGRFTVASHHTWTIPAATLPTELEVLAVADDGTVEAFRHRRRPHVGLMWHPERELDPTGPGRVALTALLETL
ncbi:MAG: gamma-glutamyl-gamma-aminobutyrate hydrolase family protein [Pseudonocardiaceae bacterium]